MRSVVVRSTTWAQRRRAAYEEEIPAHELLEALAENASGRPEKLAVLEERRAEIKKRFPKPST